MVQISKRLHCVVYCVVRTPFKVGLRRLFRGILFSYCLVSVTVSLPESLFVQIRMQLQKLLSVNPRNPTEMQKGKLIRMLQRTRMPKLIPRTQMAKLVRVPQRTRMPKLIPRTQMAKLVRMPQRTQIRQMPTLIRKLIKQRKVQQVMQPRKQQRVRLLRFSAMCLLPCLSETRVVLSFPYHDTYLPPQHVHLCVPAAHTCSLVCMHNCPEFAWSCAASVASESGPSLCWSFCKQQMGRVSVATSFLLRPD